MKLHRPSPTAATSTRYGAGSSKPKLPNSSAAQITDASPITPLARCAGAPSNRGSSHRRNAVPPSQANPPRARISTTPSRYRPGPSIGR